jgi:uncharacterized pyridoxal phosphate-dependent enzyme
VDIYDRLGVRKVINAWGTVTTAGGSLMPPEAFAAMAEAGRSFVFMDELHQKAGQYIAHLLGVEAAFVCSGAAGGLVLASAACLTGNDQHKIDVLPETDGWRNEIIVQKPAGPSYIYQALRYPGARLVHVGTPQQMTLADVESGLSANTAAIMLFLGIQRQPSIAEVAPLARRAGVPIIVDAAAEMPPRSNFTQPLKDGAHLIIFSGGKGIRGPQATGLVLGRADLVDACRLNSNPRSAIGRPMKVGKEDIAALVAALDVFMAQDEATELRGYQGRADYIAGALGGIAGVEARTLPADPRGRPVVPRVYITLAPDFRLSGKEICAQMLAGTLPVVISEIQGGIRVDVMLLEEWQVQAVARKLSGILASAAS